MDTVRVGFEAVAWTTPAPDVRQKVYAEGGRRLRLVEFGEGFVEPDWCLRGHIGFVLEGVGRLEFRGSEVTLRAGDGILIPPGNPHAHKLTVLGKVFRVFLVEDMP